MSVVEVIGSCPGLEGFRDAAPDRFWKTFAVDALIGNTDRHAGNWGYLVDMPTGDIVGLVPVYDCGSCPNPKMSEDDTRHLGDMGEYCARIAGHPKLVLTADGRRPTYTGCVRWGDALGWFGDAAGVEDPADLVDEIRRSVGCSGISTWSRSLCA